MEDSSTRTLTGSSATVESVEIDPEVFKAFDALPDKYEPQNRMFTPVEDALLLKYWPVKKHEDVAKLLGMCSTTALKRYRELTRGKG